MRLSFLAPTWLSVEKRGRVMISASGTRAFTIGSSVAEPSSMVSSRPRAWSRRSVKMWPRSGSAESCASSSATKAGRAGRHGFGGAQQPARALGLDPLLAGDQRDLAGPLIAQTRS
jgi:hypothetical protein